MKASRPTPGQRLWLSLYRADQYDEQAAAIAVPPKAPKSNANRATQKWLVGMSRHLRSAFPASLREAREAVGLTQQDLCEIAELSVTAVAMIERGERLPNIDTAARLCWAIDVAAGVSFEDLK